MADLTLFPVSFARSVAVTIAAAPIGSKRAAGCASVSAAIGAAWRLRVRRAGSSPVDAVFVDAMPVVGGEIRVPAHSVLSQFKFPFRCTLCFFDKAMQHHDAFTNQRAIKHAGNTLSTL